MITLTTPAEINSVLGGNVPVSYNKLVVSPFTMDAVAQTVSASLRLTSTTAPTMQPIVGTLRVSVPASELVIEVGQLDFYRRVVLSGAQNTALLGNIETAQAALENGLVTLAVIAGTRSAGV
jgi:hypothetical protein